MSDLGESPGGDFGGNRRLLDFHVISIFCLHRALDLIHSWKLFALEKIESGRKSLVKKKEVKIFVQRHYAFNS